MSHATAQPSPSKGQAGADPYSIPLDKIDVSDAGEVSIASSDARSLQQAIDIIRGLTMEPEVGQIYGGIVKRIVEFGAFVEILPGTDGLVHISELSNERVRRVNDVVQEGDEVVVKCISVDRDGKIRLSRKDALDANPDHIQARVLYGRLLDAQGRLADGLAMKLRALETDPFSPSVHLAIALSYWNQRQYDEAVRWATKTLELDPDHGLAREFLAGAYWAMGDFDRHMVENVRHAAAHGVPASALDELARAYERAGRAGVVRLALDQVARQPGAIPALQLALLHAELGDLDSALVELERAIETHDPCLVDLAVAPQWDALRGAPRFRRCLSAMRLAQPADVGAGR